jgi:hypothetical protein
MVLILYPTLNVDYGRRRVVLTHSAVAAEPLSRILWDQSQWCHETFKSETCAYHDGRWYFKRAQDLTMFLMKWS